MRYSGIDLYSTNSVVAVIDEEAHVLYRKRLPNNLGKRGFNRKSLPTNRVAQPL